MANDNVLIEVRENGPYLVQGPLKFKDAQGNEQVVDRAWVALCRCGGSGNKPFCDGTHSAENFQAPGGEFRKPGA
jgi:CDGSH-type Zn-finger protein